MSWTELKAADGHVLQAFVATPAKPPGGAIVVLQEIFGVNAHIQTLCERHAQQGWLAIAPALFDRVARGESMGYDAAGVARGREVKDRLTDEQALLDVQAAIDWAGAALTPTLSGGEREQTGLVAVVGFCWGGTLAWLAAARLRGLAAAVAYYGTNIAGYAHEQPKVPVLLHFGKQDNHILPEHVDKITRAWPDVPAHLYPAGHGFNCDDRPAYHAASAQLAATRTHAFLERAFSC